MREKNYYGQIKVVNTHKGNSVEEMETSWLSHEKRDVSQGHMSEDSSSVEEKEQLKENIATEGGEEDLAKMALQILQVEPPLLVPRHGSSDDELETSRLSSEEQDVNEGLILENVGDVEEEEQHKENIVAKEEVEDAAKMHDVSEGHVSEDASSVEEEEQENIATEEEEEDHAEYCPGGFHPVSVGDTWSNRCCSFSVFDLLPVMF